LVVANSVIVELKSVETMNPVFEAELLTYLKLTGKRPGLLINFNVPAIKDGIKRIGLCFGFFSVPWCLGGSILLSLW